ncbi:MAG: polymer-forming cytoskeletal protein [Spirochaetales bacterium]|nr:polymer-forming cytoskeletal protein [Spirochaetales bacterium]
MAKNSEQHLQIKTGTTLAKKTRFDGVLSFSDSLKIDGYFKGEIESTGFLFIQKGAQVHADIKVRSIVIGGSVHGNITATEKLEMLSTGQVFGNIKTPRIKIADGVEFAGSCDMMRDPDTVEIFSQSVEKLKTSIESF